MLISVSISAIPIDERDAQALRGRIIKSKPELREERDIVVEFTGKCEEILAVLTCDGSELGKLKSSAKELEFLGRELSIAERMFVDHSLDKQRTKAAASGLLFSLIATAAGGDAGKASLNNDIATTSSMRDFQQRVSSVFGRVRTQIERGKSTSIGRLRRSSWAFDAMTLLRDLGS